MTQGLAAVRVKFRHERNLGGGVPSTAYIGFDLPVAVAAARDDRLYVVTRARSITETSAPRGKDPASGIRQEARLADRVWIWTFGDEPTDKPMKRFGGGRGGAGELIWPSGVATGDARVYITDEATHDVRVFDLDGEHVETWSRYGSGLGELRSPAGVTVEADGNVLVVDSANHRLQRFTPHGQPVAAFGEHGHGRGQLDRPWGVAVDGRQDIYVSDWRNDRIQKFTRDGRYLATFGSSGSGEGQLRRPAGIAVDGYGCLYVADSANDRVAVFAPDGGHYATLLGDATLGKGVFRFYNNYQGHAQTRASADTTEFGRTEQRLRHPLGVAIDWKGRVLVVDTERHRIQVYERIAFDLPPVDKNGEHEPAPTLQSAASVTLGGAAIGRHDVSPVLTTFLLAWGEGWTGHDPAALSSYAHRIARTAGSSVQDDRRAWLATDWLVRVAAPAWLDLAGLTAHAAKLRALPQLDSTSDLAGAVRLVESARDAAYEAAWSVATTPSRSAAYDAARAQVWPSARAAASDELAIGARNIAGAAAWVAATDKGIAGTLSDLRESAMLLFERMI